MKEIGMEKLIELLNEYDTEIMKSETRPRATYKGKLSCCWYDMHEVSSDLLGYLIISKQFRFIKWLVENDKIDREQFYDKARKIITDFDLRGEYEGGCNEIIMLLAIQDEPIRFLCDILK